MGTILRLDVYGTSTDWVQRPADLDFDLGQNFDRSKASRGQVFLPERRQLRHHHPATNSCQTCSNDWRISVGVFVGTLVLNRHRWSTVQSRFSLGNADSVY
jgi:hypothetical protein